MPIQLQTYKTKVQYQNAPVKKYPVLRDNISIKTTVHVLPVKAVRIAVVLPLMVTAFLVALSYPTDTAVAVALRE